MSRPSAPPPGLSRRRVLAIGAWMGAIAIAPLSGCADAGSSAPTRRAKPPPPLGGPDGHGYGDNLDALFDVLLPAERDDAGMVVSPGAREAGAGEVLAVPSFVSLAVLRGLLPPLSDAIVSELEALDGLAWATLDAELDVLASFERPLTPFRELPLDLQERVVSSAWGDDALRPALLVVRAACFAGYLGAIVSDVGLREVGFPPFEDFADGIAVSGYPRTSADGTVDDYTYNLTPAPTPGEDLSLLLDAHGDLLG